MKMKVSDYIVEYFQKKGVTTAFSVSGGACAHLLESVRTSKINTIFNYHEQACAMSADGYARMSKKPAIVLVTNGPGSTNTLTGIVGAWQDSIPMIVISGQVTRNHTMYNESSNVRQIGVQEADIISMVANYTKYCKQIHIVDDIPFILNSAWEALSSGRMGPIWLDIPLDIQSSNLTTNIYESVESIFKESYYDINQVYITLVNASRPLIIIGNGIHLSNTEEPFIDFIQRMKIPVISTWNASDILSYDNELYIGNFGILGERVANIAVQEADVILILGSRLSIPCIGYNANAFAHSAVKIMVDIDDAELNKNTLSIDIKCKDDLNSFFSKTVDMYLHSDISNWINKIISLKKSLSIFKEPHTRHPDAINSYDLIEELGKCITSDDCIVTDMGTSFTCTMQALRNNGNRLFTSSGLSSMGFGLPGAIGALVSGIPNRVICISGDGGFQMNIQELQTIVAYSLPIKMIVLNNGGYLAISLMQDNLFKHRFGADIPAPNFCNIANAYGIPSIHLKCHNDISKLKEAINLEGPVLIEINMVKNQLLIPRVMSYRDKATGDIKSGKLECMFPPLEI
jgi:acetolactate synthase-1/2/3 large subunit